MAKERAIQEEKARERTILSNWRSLTGSDTGKKIQTYNYIFKYYGCGFHVFGNEVFPSNIIVPSGVKYISGFTRLTDDIRWTMMHHTDIIEGPKSADWKNQEELLNARQRVFSALHSLEIQDGVEEIGNDAFMNCDSLSILSLPNSLKKINTSAFSGCCSLNRITIPDSVESIGQGAFSGCSPSAYFISNKFCPLGERFLIAGNMLLSVALNGVDTITIPNTIEIIGPRAFRNCKTLKHITIPTSVTQIGAGAFEGCTSLQSTVIPESVTQIGRSAFKGCTSLQSIEIHNSETKIAPCAFEGCSILKSMVRIR